MSVEVRIDRAEWAKFQRDLRALEPATRKAVNRKVRKLGAMIVADAKANASWSSRIPGAIGMTVSLTKVGLRVNRKTAPHARPYEGIASGGGTFRHPVFGNRQVWVSEQTRPFLSPAVEAHRDEFVQQVGEAVDEAARSVGWR